MVQFLIIYIEISFLDCKPTKSGLINRILFVRFYLRIGLSWTKRITENTPVCVWPRKKETTAPTTARLLVNSSGKDTFFDNSIQTERWWWWWYSELRSGSRAVSSRRMAGQNLRILRWRHPMTLSCRLEFESLKCRSQWNTGATGNCTNRGCRCIPCFQYLFGCTCLLVSQT